MMPLKTRHKKRQMQVAYPVKKMQKTSSNNYVFYGVGVCSGIAKLLTQNE